jgi:O-glycosyl hydrolase
LLGVILATFLFASCRAADAVVQQQQPPPPPVSDSTVTVSVDNSVAYQVVDGFGGNTLSLTYPNGDHLGVYRPAAIRAAFGSVGITHGLLNIGVVEAPANATDPYGQRANDNADPLVINPAGFNFTGSDNLRQGILAPASAFGYATAELGPLINVTNTLDWLKPIRDVDYRRYLDEVAEHVLAIMQQWRDAYGVTPRLLHLFNEPTSGNTELQSSSVQEVVDIVKNVGARLRGAGFADVKFIVPNEETISRSIEVASAILADPAARPYVGVIGFHPYPYGSVYSSPKRILETSGAGAPDATTRAQLAQLKALGLQYGVPIWMTEVTEGPGNNDFSFDAIENVLARAIHIHDNFEFGGASAFFGMNTLWDSQTHAEHFASRGIPFLSEQSGMVLVDVGSGEIRITGMGYAVGHYARWLKPLAVRIGATSTNARMLVTVFRDVASKRIIVVVVNTQASSQPFRIVLAGASVSGDVSGESSYAAVRWQVIPAFRATGNGNVEFTAPARSVVSLALPTP